jgi:hypothetical protein
MPTLKLGITGVVGPDDVRRLESAFAAEPGVYRAVACQRSDSVEIDFEDDEVTPDRLLEVARTAGYQAYLAS